MLVDTQSPARERWVKWANRCDIDRGFTPAALSSGRSAGGRTAPRRAAIAYWGKVACFRATSLAFLAVYTLTLDSGRCGLNWMDSCKSFRFNDMTPLISGFFRKFHDMRIFGPLQSPEKRRQPAILAPRYCWKQWGSTSPDRLAVSFFAGASVRGNQSLTRTSHNPNGEGGQRRMLCSEAADPTLPCGALNLALAFSVTSCRIWLLHFLSRFGLFG